MFGQAHKWEWVAVKRTLVLLILVAMMSGLGADSVREPALLVGSASLPLAAHAAPTPVQGSTASGWSSSSNALAPPGSASTTKDATTLTVAGFAGNATGTITGVTVHAVASQVEHYDDRLRMSVTAPGCAGVARDLPLSDKPTEGSLAMPCDWTWGRIEGLEVSLRTEAAGGLLGMGRIDGAWRTNHVWLEVTISDRAPVAVVGPDLTVNEGAPTTLSGAGSYDPEGSPISHAWTQTGGPTVVLTPAGSDAHFRAPMLGSNQPASLSFRLTVTDPQGHTGHAAVQVTVQNVNQAPIARAGSDQTITSGTTVLDGSASSDGDGDSLSYSWSQLSGPAATLTGADTAQVVVTPAPGTSVFRLRVADGWGGVANDDVAVVVPSQDDSGAGADPPVAPPPAPPTTPPSDPSDGPDTGPGTAPAPGATTPGGSGSPSAASPGRQDGASTPATTDWMTANAGRWGPWALAGLGTALVGIIPARRWLHRRHEARHLDRPQIVLGDLDQEIRNDEIVQFLNNASHDLASPLTPIRIQLAMLENVKGELTERQKKAWDVVKRNIDQMGLLVTDIRDAARMQAGHLALYPEPLDLVRLVTESVESFEGPAEEKGVKLSLDHDGTPFCIDGDAGRLTQVLYNLINNALKFTDAGGRIQVALRRADEGRVVVAIRDTGLGMTADDAARLFQPFSQAHDAKQKKKGSGLGLFISKGIIEGHHGDIWCDSPGPGKGSVFAFTLALSTTPLVSEPLLA